MQHSGRHDIAIATTIQCENLVSDRRFSYRDSTIVVGEKVI
ncbi:hypothetical protein [uncultured Nostoc sp.]|nr:hypothetical protein [uncultured Nostoc sp.]